MTVIVVNVPLDRVAGALDRWSARILEILDSREEEGAEGDMGRFLAFSTEDVGLGDLDPEATA
jgi:hypothetical protein